LAVFFDRKDDYAYVRWAREVKAEAHYTCALCGRKGGVLHSHHLNAWASFPEQRYNISNGVALCKFHHDDFHEKYGKGKNTKEQFEEYTVIAELIMKVSNRNAVINSASKKMLQIAERDQVIEDIFEAMKEEQDGYEEEQ